MKYVLYFTLWAISKSRRCSKSFLTILVEPLRFKPCLADTFILMLTLHQANCSIILLYGWAGRIMKYVLYFTLWAISKSRRCSKSFLTILVEPLRFKPCLADTFILMLTLHQANCSIILLYGWAGRI